MAIDGSANRLNFKVNQFRFLSNTETFLDKRFDRWSRCYEWAYVLDIVKTIQPQTIHNTCCGYHEIHKQFHDCLLELCPNLVNSDISTNEINKSFHNFREYNILEPCSEQFDLVLCISTLEELPTQIEVVFNNLLDQLKPSGRLIVTCDYPDIDVSQLEDVLHVKCQDVENRLNGMNSFYKQSEHENLNVILMDLTKI